MDPETDHLPSDHATLTPTEIAPATQLAALRKIFIGKDGLRAGWSLLVYIVLVATILFCATAIGHKLPPPAAKSAKTAADMSDPTRAIIGGAIPFLVVVFVTWIMSKIERRRNSVYGLGGSRKLSHFLAGLAWESPVFPCSS